jgi:hypothetical protein
MIARTDVEIAPSWLVFTNFLADMGERPEGKVLERVDISAGFCKDNCRWGKDTRFTVRHGMTFSPTYTSWNGMKNRCLNPKVKDFKYYGGRGISIDPRWMLFENFLADMGERPEGTTIDRIEVNGNYCKSNCRWAGPDIQGRNRRNVGPVNQGD